MIKRTIILCCLIVGALIPCRAQNQVVVTPAGEMERAVSGHFAGMVNGELKTWGGCNFPDVPCADGGMKVFYPKAYGASVTVPEGTVFVGGASPLTPLRGEGNKGSTTISTPEVTFLPSSPGATGVFRGVTECDSGHTKGSKSPLTRESRSGKGAFPSLPKGLDNFAACYGADRIFVAGGQSNGVPNREVYVLDWPDGKEWVKIATLPDEGRLQPCMAVQNAPEGKALYIFGGYKAPSPLPLWGSASVFLKGLKLNLDIHNLFVKVHKRLT